APWPAPRLDPVQGEVPGTGHRAPRGRCPGRANGARRAGGRPAQGAARRADRWPRPRARLRRRDRARDQRPRRRRGLGAAGRELDLAVQPIVLAAPGRLGASVRPRLRGGAAERSIRRQRSGRGGRRGRRLLDAPGRARQARPAAGRNLRARDRRGLGYPRRALARPLQSDRRGTRDRVLSAAELPPPDYSLPTLDHAMSAVEAHRDVVSMIATDALNPLRALSFLRYKILYVHLTNVYDN